MLDNDKLFRIIAKFLSYVKGDDVEKGKYKGLKIPKPILLYARLISKTKLVHEKSIAKHCDIFRKYFENNAVGILSKDLSQLTDRCIKYSDTIYIDLEFVFKNNVVLGGEEKIWIELTKLLAYFVPASGAKNALKDIKEKMANSNNREGKLISDLIQKVESKVGGDDPMVSFGAMVNGGEMKNIIQDVVGGLGDGSLNIGGIFNQLQGLISQNMDDGDPTTQMFSGIIGNLGAQFDAQMNTNEKDIDLEEVD